MGKETGEYRGPGEQWTQRTTGTVEIEDRQVQRTRGPVSTEDQRAQRTGWPEDQRISGCRGPVGKGPEEQWVRGPVDTEDLRNSGNRGPVGKEDQRNGGNRGPVGTEEQRNSGHRYPVRTEDQRNSGNRGTMGKEDHWVQRTRGTVGTEDQWVQRPEVKWEQRTSGTVGTEDQRNSGYRGPEKSGNRGRIAPGRGAYRNEALHRWIGHLLNGGRVGVRLVYALLMIVFDGINHKDRKSSSVLPEETRVLH
ncbi:hypothetical protein AWC38_SpisGene17149 [Stylophora pistillata]|uniref:Uncharacterized protein n=1 Tax=Stylophora pistillata TaxID=50429 RepID=A0A2B4RNV2_STYPI|nr:hypothetical protein AWC38_SpisGene17149 [Stylophora pistillata]